MKLDEVFAYYKILKKRKISLFIKRIFDISISLFLLILLCPIMLVITLIIKLDSKGPAFFKQERGTQYNRTFEIMKFRTMVSDAEEYGTRVTAYNDSRITKVGGLLRKYRIDEIPQLINVLKGDMSFVGARPEVAEYIESYTDEMMATLLLPAGITSMASIKFKDEERLLRDYMRCNEGVSINLAYTEYVLPMKMKYNTEYLKNFKIMNDIKICFKTVLAVCRKKDDAGE
ncbi:sugar transferase [[Clostridium] innocuum]|nr:sugar transferase [[Clostridium] innocuum]MCR0260936.1 sugar transferase [[Clostridium] innocuum]MCR0392559.1 sugar transferase [[Clostridium] innocuum]MCR0502729.1 sugar transferase [[Clostridium] innocuum]